MNKVVLMGRLVADPEVRYSQNENSTAVARYRLAVDRRFKKDGEQQADFISCVAFGKNGEFAEKYLHKGMKICISGRIQTGSYEKEGVKHYTTDIVVEEHDFCENKGTSQDYAPTSQAADTSGSGFIQIDSGIEDELPF